MIVDRLSNAAEYFGVSSRLAAALHYLNATDFDALPPGRYDIDGARMYALVFEYQTKPRATAFWEAHRQFIDVQYVHRGVELMGYAPLEDLVAGPYDVEKDYLKADGEGDFLQLRAGSFVVFGPQDAHMPGVALGDPQPVKKIVIKVAVQ